MIPDKFVGHPPRRRPQPDASTLSSEPSNRREALFDDLPVIGSSTPDARLMPGGGRPSGAVAVVGGAPIPAALHARITAPPGAVSLTAASGGAGEPLPASRVAGAEDRHLRQQQSSGNPPSRGLSTAPFEASFCVRPSVVASSSSSSSRSGRGGSSVFATEGENGHGSRLSEGERIKEALRRAKLQRSEEPDMDAAVSYSDEDDDEGESDSGTRNNANTSGGCSNATNSDDTWSRRHLPNASPIAMVTTVALPPLTVTPAPTPLQLTAQVPTPIAGSSPSSVPFSPPQKHAAKGVPMPHQVLSPTPGRASAPVERAANDENENEDRCWDAATPASPLKMAHTTSTAAAPSCALQPNSSSHHADAPLAGGGAPSPNIRSISPSTSTYLRVGGTTPLLPRVLAPVTAFDSQLIGSNNELTPMASPDAAAGGGRGGGGGVREDIHISPLPRGRAADVSSCYSDHSARSPSDINNSEGGRAHKIVATMRGGGGSRDDDGGVHQLNLYRPWWNLLVYSDGATERSFMCRFYHRQYISPGVAAIYTIYWLFTMVRETEALAMRTVWVLPMLIAFTIAAPFCVARMAFLLHRMDVEYGIHMDMLRVRGGRGAESGGRSGARRGGAAGNLALMVLVEAPFPTTLAVQFERAILSFIIVTIITTMAPMHYAAFLCKDELHCRRAFPLFTHWAMMIVFLLCIELRFSRTVFLAAFYVLIAAVTQIRGTLSDFYTSKDFAPASQHTQRIVDVSVGLGLLGCRALKEHLKRRRFEQIVVAQEGMDDLHVQRLKMQSLLKNIQSCGVLERLLNGNQVVNFADPCTVVVAKVNNYHAWTYETEPLTTVRAMVALVRAFDTLATSHGMEKVCGSGDEYRVVSGMESQLPHHAEAAIFFSFALINAMESFNHELLSGFFGEEVPEKKKSKKGAAGAQNAGGSAQRDTRMSPARGNGTRSEDDGVAELLRDVDGDGGEDDTKDDDAFVGGDLPEDAETLERLLLDFQPPLSLVLGVGVHAGSVVSLVMGTSTFSYETFGITSMVAAELAARAPAENGVVASEAVVGIAMKQSGSSTLVQGAKIVDISIPELHCSLRAFQLKFQDDLTPLIDMLEIPGFSQFDQMFALMLSPSTETLSDDSAVRNSGFLAPHFQRAMQFDQDSLELQLHSFHNRVLARIRLGNRVVLFVLSAAILTSVFLENKQQGPLGIVALVLSLAFSAAACVISLYGTINTAIHIAAVALSTLAILFCAVSLDDSVAINSAAYIVVLLCINWPAAVNLQKTLLSVATQCAFVVAPSIYVLFVAKNEHDVLTVALLFLAPLTILAAVNQHIFCRYTIRYESSLANIINIVDRKRSILKGLVSLFVPSHALSLMLAQHDMERLLKPFASVLEDEVVKATVTRPPPLRRSSSFTTTPSASSQSQGDGTQRQQGSAVDGGGAALRHHLTRHPLRIHHYTGISIVALQLMNLFADEALHQPMNLAAIVGDLYLRVDAVLHRLCTDGGRGGDTDTDADPAAGATSGGGSNSGAHSPAAANAAPSNPAAVEAAVDPPGNPAAEVAGAHAAVNLPLLTVTHIVGDLIWIAGPFAERTTVVGKGADRQETVDPLDALPEVACSTSSARRSSGGAKAGGGVDGGGDSRSIDRRSPVVHSLVLAAEHHSHSDGSGAAADALHRRQPEQLVCSGEGGGGDDSCSLIFIAPHVEKTQSPCASQQDAEDAVRRKMRASDELRRQRGKKEAERVRRVDETKDRALWVALRAAVELQEAFIKYHATVVRAVVHCGEAFGAVPGRMRLSYAMYGSAMDVASQALRAAPRGAVWATGGAVSSLLRASVRAERDMGYQGGAPPGAARAPSLLTVPTSSLRDPAPPLQPSEGQSSTQQQQQHSRQLQQQILQQHSQAAAHSPGSSLLLPTLTMGVAPSTSPIFANGASSGWRAGEGRPLMEIGDGSLTPPLESLDTTLGDAAAEVAACNGNAWGSGGGISGVPYRLRSTSSSLLDMHQPPSVLGGSSNDGAFGAAAASAASGGVVVPMIATGSGSGPRTSGGSRSGSSADAHTFCVADWVFEGSALILTRLEQQLPLVPGASGGSDPGKPSKPGGNCSSRGHAHEQSPPRRREASIGSRSAMASGPRATDIFSVTRVLEGSDVPELAALLNPATAATADAGRGGRHGGLQSIFRPTGSSGSATMQQQQLELGSGSGTSASRQFDARSSLESALPPSGRFASDVIGDSATLTEDASQVPPRSALLHSSNSTANVQSPGRRGRAGGGGRSPSLRSPKRVPPVTHRASSSHALARLSISPSRPSRKN